MRLPPRLLALILATTPLFAAEPSTASVKFPGYGFEIGALETGDPRVNFMPLTMSLPASDGFAPNINVTLQSHKDSLASFVSLTKEQFAQMQLTLVEEQLVGDYEWRVEYTGPFRNSTLHWYARAVAKDGRVYLATATALETQWPKVGARLREGVDSFKLTP